VATTFSVLLALMPETVGSVDHVHVHGPEPDPVHELLHEPASEAWTAVTDAEKFSVRLEMLSGVFESYVKYMLDTLGVVGVVTPAPACTLAPLKPMAAVNA
jgi:hypothetical protein